MPRLRTIAFVAFAAQEAAPPLAGGIVRERARRPLVHAGAIDLVTVDMIARLHLRARRAGLRMTLHHPVPELAELLGLTGLDAWISSDR